MKIDDMVNEALKDYSFNDFMKKTSNGLMLRDEEINILERNNIHYERVSNLSELIYEIEEALNEEENDELENLQAELAERNYYENTNK